MKAAELAALNSPEPSLHSQSIPLAKCIVPPSTRIVPLLSMMRWFVDEPSTSAEFVEVIRASDAITSRLWGNAPALICDPSVKLINPPFSKSDPWLKMSVAAVAGNTGLKLPEAMPRTFMLAVLRAQLVPPTVKLTKTFTVELLKL